MEVVTHKLDRRIDLVCDTRRETTSIQNGVFESRMPGATWLDFQVAYEQLPMDSRGRTQVYLLLLGNSEQEINDQSDLWFHWSAPSTDPLRDAAARTQRSPAPISGAGLSAEPDG